MIRDLGQRLDPVAADALIERLLYAKFAVHDLAARERPLKAGRAALAHFDRLGARGRGDCVFGFWLTHGSCLLSEDSL